MSGSDTVREPEAPSYRGFRSLTMEITDDDVNAAMLAKASEMRPTFRAPGFRPGKVPTQFIVSRMGAEMRGEIFHDLCQARANEAIPERDKESLLAMPVIRDSEDASDTPGTRRFLIEYNLLPEVPPLDFEAMEFERPEVTLDDEAVRKTILRDLEREPLAGEPVAAKAAEPGDYVDLDYVLFMHGKEFATSEGGDPHRVLASSEAEADSASRRVLGMAAGGSFSQEHVFPGDAEDPRLRGARGEYRFTVRDVLPPVSPALDERLVKASGFESVEALIEGRRQFLVGMVKAVERRYLHTQLYRKLSGVEAEIDPRQERSLALRIRSAEISTPQNGEPEGGGDGDEDRKKPKDGLTPEDMARARRIVRYQVMLAILTKRLGIAVQGEDLPRALVGWTVDPSDPAHRYAFARAANSLKEDAFLRRQALSEAATEKLLDAILPRARAVGSEISLEALESRIQQESKEWMIARALN